MRRGHDRWGGVAKFRRKQSGLFESLTNPDERMGEASTAASNVSADAIPKRTLNSLRFAISHSIQGD